MGQCPITKLECVKEACELYEKEHEMTDTWYLSGCVFQLSLYALTSILQNIDKG